jgi:hypothetical protein
LAGNLEVVGDLKIQPILRRCAEVPRQTHSGVHGDGALLPLTIALIRFIGTRSARASSFRLTPISPSSSRSNSPGWMGGSFLRCAMVLLPQW